MDRQRRQRILIKLAHTKNAGVITNFAKLLRLPSLKTVREARLDKPLSSVGKMNRAVKDSEVVSKFIGSKKVEGGSTFPYTKAQLRTVMSPVELTRFYRGARQADINTRPIHGNYPGWGGFYPFKGRPGRIGMIAEELGVPATEADIQAKLSKIRLAQSESTRNMRNAMEAATKGKLR